MRNRQVYSTEGIVELKKITISESSRKVPLLPLTLCIYNIECFFLRILLKIVRRPKSFADLISADDVRHPTFKAAYSERYVLESD